MLKFAVTYCPQSADLLRSGQINFDLFKCPAWPDLLSTVRTIYPLYVHFPLKVGQGIGDAIDTETHQPADWHKVETLLAQTDTLQVNAHLAPDGNGCLDIPAEAVECGIRDVRTMVTRFGPECVIVENDNDDGGRRSRVVLQPEVIRCVIEETGCGFLLDVSHACLAANYLGVDVHEYIRALPVDRLREMHISGLQRFEGRWVDDVRRAGVDISRVQHFVGKVVDHLPMTDADWELAEWSMEQVRKGAWAQPSIVAFEYGGVGPLWEAVTDRQVLLEQVPRLSQVVK